MSEPVGLPLAVVLTLRLVEFTKFGRLFAVVMFAVPTLAVDWDDARDMDSFAGAVELMFARCVACPTVPSCE